MRLNKLLPIGSVFTIGVVLAPILTSCSAYTFEYGNKSFNKKELSLKTKQLNKAPESGKETDFYMEHIYKDHQILADDMAYSMHLNYWEENRWEELSLSIKLSNNPNTKNHSISLVMDSNGVEKETKKSISMHYVIQNAVIELVNTNSNWLVSPKFYSLDTNEEKIKLLKDNDCAVTWKRTEVNGSRTRTSIVDLNSKLHADENHLDDWLEVYYYLKGESWYFGKI